MCSNTKIILVILDFTGDFISITCILYWIQYMDRSELYLKRFSAKVYLAIAIAIHLYKHS